MKSFFCSTTKGALLLSRPSFSLLHSACICHPLALQDIHTYHVALCRAFLETYKSISAVRTLSGQRQTRMKWQYRLEDQRRGRWYRCLPSSLSFLLLSFFRVFYFLFKQGLIQTWWSLILLLPFRSKDWGLSVLLPSLCSGESGTHGLVFARQALYPLSHIPVPFITFLISSYFLTFMANFLYTTWSHLTSIYFSVWLPRVFMFYL